jgi:signal transduction histidine kinase
MTRALVADLVQLTLQLDPAKAHRGPTPPGAVFNPAELSPRIDRDSEQIAQLLSLCNSFVRRTGQESVRDAHAAIVVVVTIAALMLAVALAGSFWEYRNVIVPLRYLRQWCRRTAAGDFSVRCTPAADGEFHDLGRDINQMADELSGFYRKLEEMVARKSRELVRAERLASVGYLAAGVAHEINNPLNIISGYAELSLKALRRNGVSARDAEAVEHLAIIRSEAFRCKEITTRLLSLAKGGADGREIVSLRDAVENIADLVRGLKIIRHRRLRVDLDDEKPLLVQANLTEMKLVLLNLIVNAFEAVSEGGEVTVTGVSAAGWVEVEVVDNGRGMSGETLERVFEPFFTNKRGAGEPGTGLGLSISYAIITGHGGEIHAQSDGPGRGSRFKIRLPAAPPNARVLQHDPAPEVMA